MISIVCQVVVALLLALPCVSNNENVRCRSRIRGICPFEGDWWVPSSECWLYSPGCRANTYDGHFCGSSCIVSSHYTRTPMFCENDPQCYWDWRTRACQDRCEGLPVDQCTKFAGCALARRINGTELIECSTMCFYLSGRNCENYAANKCRRSGDLCLDSCLLGNATSCSTLGTEVAPCRWLSLHSSCTVACFSLMKAEDCANEPWCSWWPHGCDYNCTALYTIGSCPAQKCHVVNGRCVDNCRMKWKTNTDECNADSSACFFPKPHPGVICANKCEYFSSDCPSSCQLNQTSGKCEPSCLARHGMNESDCQLDPFCQWERHWPGLPKCTQKCDYYLTAELCLQNDCLFNSTSSSCTQSCIQRHSTDASCKGDAHCVWDEFCRENCRDLNQTQCFATGYCAVISSTQQCGPRCDYLFFTQADCLAEAPFCYWAGDRCFNNCTIYYSSESCAAASHCILQNKMCLPLCSWLYDGDSFFLCDSDKNCWLGSDNRCKNNCSLFNSDECRRVDWCIYDNIDFRCRMGCEIVHSTSNASTCSADKYCSYFEDEAKCRDSCQTFGSNQTDCTARNYCFVNVTGMCCDNCTAKYVELESCGSSQSCWWKSNTCYERCEQFNGASEYCLRQNYCKYNFTNGNCARSCRLIFGIECELEYDCYFDGFDCWDKCELAYNEEDCAQRLTCFFNSTDQCNRKCDRFVSSGDCKHNPVCEYLNDRCVARCSQFDGREEGCQKNAHCWYVNESASCQRNCVAYGDEAQQKQYCLEHSDCEWVNRSGLICLGKCQLFHGEPTQCKGDEPWYCQYWEESQACLPNCHARHRNSPDSCDSDPSCWLLGSGSCITNCSSLQRFPDVCQATQFCVYDNISGVCRFDCYGVDSGNKTFCLEKRDCMWSSFLNQCVDNCTAYFPNLAGCEQANTCTRHSQTCFQSCRYLHGMNETSCRADEKCFMAKQCQNRCGIGKQCVYPCLNAPGQCLFKCLQLTEKADCLTVAYCRWLNASTACVPRCEEFETNPDYCQLQTPCRYDVVSQKCVPDCSSSRLQESAYCQSEGTCWWDPKSQMCWDDISCQALNSSTCLEDGRCFVSNQICEQECVWSRKCSEIAKCTAITLESNTSICVPHCSELENSECEGASPSCWIDPLTQRCTSCNTTDPDVFVMPRKCVVCSNIINVADCESYTDECFFDYYTGTCADRCDTLAILYCATAVPRCYYDVGRCRFNCTHLQSSQCDLGHCERIVPTTTSTLSLSSVSKSHSNTQSDSDSALPIVTQSQSTTLSNVSATLSRNTSPSRSYPTATLSIPIPVPVPARVMAKVIAESAVPVTAMAVVGSSMAATPAASALQQLGLMGNMACASVQEKAAVGNSRILAPLALYDSLDGMAISNIVVVLAFGLLQLFATVCFYELKRKKNRKQWIPAMAVTRAPSLFFAVANTFHQATTFLVFLCLREQLWLIGGIGLVYCLVMPFAAVVTTWRCLYARLYYYDIEAWPHCKIPLSLRRWIFPHSVWLPQESRRCFGSLFSSHTSVHWQVCVLPFVTTTIISVICSVDPSGVSAGCTIQYSFLAVVFALFAALYTIPSLHRHLLNRVLAVASNLVSCGLMATAAVRVNVAASYQRNVETVLLSIVQLQVLLTLVRISLPVCNFFTESRFLSKLPQTFRFSIGTERKSASNYLLEQYSEEELEEEEQPMLQVAPEQQQQPVPGHIEDAEVLGDESEAEDESDAKEEQRKREGSEMEAEVFSFLTSEKPSGFFSKDERGQALFEELEEMLSVKDVSELRAKQQNEKKQPTEAEEAASEKAQQALALL